jgi:hypothetical protein
MYYLWLLLLLSGCVALFSFYGANEFLLVYFLFPICVVFFHSVVCSLLAACLMYVYFVM